MYKLIIEDDEGKTTVVPLIRDEITIGRKEGNTIRLTERNVSRKHARLSKQNGSVYIEDLTSYNGTKINGDKIDGRSTVSEGDRIQIGDYLLALKMDKTPGAPGGSGGGRELNGAAPTVEMPDQKTTPFIKENGTPTQLIESPTLQNPVQPVAGRSETMARLVVVSSNFAGQEYLLDKAAVVIGRTDENDVVINHRSISRHHAKVVRENAHYHIVDLQSANGVRVNGEEYGKVELRKGDEVDLGHVRLRFVGPGEDFVFERDARVVDVGGGQSNKSVLSLVAIIVVLVAGGSLLLMRLTGQRQGGEVQRAQQSGDTESQVARLLLDADRATRTEDWEQAIAKCDEALKIDPTQEVARDKRKRAEAERRNRVTFTSFSNAADRQDFDTAVTTFGEIAEDSVYRQKGQDRYAQMKNGYLRVHLDAARKAKAQDRCKEARQHVEAALTVDEGNAEAQEIIRACENGGKLSTNDRHSHPGTEARAPKATPPEAREPREPREPKEPREPHVTKTAVSAEEGDTPAPPGVNPAIEKLLQDAQDAYVHGSYASAIDLAKKTARAQPFKAWRIIGASNCFLKDRAGAQQAWSKLDATGRQFLKYVCSRNAVTVP